MVRALLRTATEAVFRLRSARGWILRLAALSQGPSLSPTRPVRANCCPDRHLDRPPVLPASAPFALMVRDLPANGRGIVAATRILLRIVKTVMTRPSSEQEDCLIFLVTEEVKPQGKKFYSFLF